MTLHLDETAIRNRASEIADKAAKRKRRKVMALAPVGLVLAGGAAFAAVQIFGFGSINAEAATTKDLKVTNAKLSSSLVPGQSAKGSVDVLNENDFPVVVTGVILQDSSLQATGAGCDPASVSPGGSPIASYPGQGGGPGHQINLGQAVTIPGGEVRTITANNVVSQAASATKLCGVKANFAVVSQVGN